MAQTIWYWISLPYAAGGVSFLCGVGREAPPIFQWMIGKPIKTVADWVRKKGGTIEVLP